MNYGSYEYNFSFEITLDECIYGDTLVEKDATMVLECVCRGHPGSFNPIDGGYPPEGPEFDVIRVDIDSENSIPIPYSWAQVLNIFGEKMMEKIYDDACGEAACTGDFG
jgi:hypothetical protein